MSKAREIILGAMRTIEEEDNSEICRGRDGMCYMMGRLNLVAAAQGACLLHLNRAKAAVWEASVCLSLAKDEDSWQNPTALSLLAQAVWELEAYEAHVNRFAARAWHEEKETWAA